MTSRAMDIGKYGKIVKYFVCIFILMRDRTGCLKTSRENFLTGIHLVGGKEPICQCRRQKRGGFLGQEESLEKEVATHSSILA